MFCYCSLVLLLTSIAAVPALAGDLNDAHTSQYPGSSLMQFSPFAHGYLHGYEEGFHVGNLDLHMARPPRDPLKIKESKKVVGYSRVYGDRVSFKKGYTEGFRVAYTDAVAGRSFRVVEQMRAAAEPMKTAKLDGVFDEGFRVGYTDGQKQGLHDARATAAFRDSARHCPVGRLEYCEGYSRAYRIGYSDGYENQRHTTLTAAAAAKPSKTTTTVATTTVAGSK